MQLRDGRKLNITRYSSWGSSARMATGSPQPRTGPSLTSASPIHIELLLTRRQAGTLQILLHLLLGFLGFLFLLQHRSVGCLPLQVADEVTHFSAPLQKASDSQAGAVSTMDFPSSEGGSGAWQETQVTASRVPPRACNTKYNAPSRYHQVCSQGNMTQCHPQLQRGLSIIRTPGCSSLLYKASRTAKYSPHTSLDSASCQLEQNIWWGNWREKKHMSS